MGTKIKRIICVFSAVFTATGFIVAFTPVANLLARPLVVEPDLRKADLIVVLGGGAYKNGVLARGSSERLIYGLILYKNGFARALVFSGGSVTDVAKKVFHTVTKSEAAAKMDVIEASIMQDVAINLGIPEEATHVDGASTNTYTNLVLAKAYMEEKGFKNCLIVTSPTHMLRAWRISKKLGLRCYPAPVKDYTQLRTTAVDRVSLFWEVGWEYSALALYRLYGYI